MTKRDGATASGTSAAPVRAAGISAQPAHPDCRTASSADSDSCASSSPEISAHRRGFNTGAQRKAATSSALCGPLTALALLTAVLMPRVSSASEAHVRVIITGQKFVDEARSADEAKVMHAAGYMHAVQDMIALQGVVCMPKGIGTIALMDQLSRHISQREDRDRLPAAYFIGRYLLDRWPCDADSSKEPSLSDVEGER